MKVAKIGYSGKALAIIHEIDRLFNYEYEERWEEITKYLIENYQFRD